MPDLVGCYRWKSIADARSQTGESAEKSKFRYIPKLQRGPRVGFRHCLVFALIALAGEQLDLVLLDWIVLRGTGGEHAEATIDALGATTAVAVLFPHLAGPRAAHGILNQVRAATIDDRTDHIRFDVPDERVLDLNRLAKQPTT
jgi:hypothetical protein